MKLRQVRLAQITEDGYQELVTWVDDHPLLACGTTLDLKGRDGRWTVTATYRAMERDEINSYRTFGPSLNSEGR